MNIEPLKQTPSYPESQKHQRFILSFEQDPPRFHSLSTGTGPSSILQKPARSCRQCRNRANDNLNKCLAIILRSDKHSQQSVARTFLSIALAVSTAARPCTLRNAPTSPSVSSNRFNACVTSPSEDTRPDRTASAASRSGDGAEAVDMEHGLHAPFEEALLFNLESEKLLVVRRLVEQVNNAGF